MMPERTSDSDPGLGLRHYFGQLARIPDAEWEHLRQHVRVATFTRHEYLIRSGEPARSFWFLRHGLVRFCYTTDAGQEFNKAFARGGDLIGPLVAAITNTPCGFSIQALRDTEALSIPVSLIPSLYDRHPCWERLGRRIAEEAAIRKEIREREFLLDDPLTRYRQFLQRYPGIETDIPQKQIAAYVGVSEVTLSRLLRRQDKR